MNGPFEACEEAGEANMHASAKARVRVNLGQCALGGLQLTPCNKEAPQTFTHSHL